MKMNRIYDHIPDLVNKGTKFAFTVILEKKGSAPQEQGSAALISAQGLLAGTLGGGLLEAETIQRTQKALSSGRSGIFQFDLTKNIEDDEGAICGGRATILIDVHPENHLDVFRKISGLREQEEGYLLTTIHPEGEIERVFIPELKQPGFLPGLDPGETGNLKDQLTRGNTGLIRTASGNLVFAEWIRIPDRLFVFGAGHVGKALCHLAALLNFQITVIDDRPEFANPQQIPEADTFITEPLPGAISNLEFTPETYVVIVTRDHKNDALALKACIHKPARYIGMMGSRRKISLIRKKFIDEGWATADRFDRVHAPIGLNIGGARIEEVALSIAAELVQVRNSGHEALSKKSIGAVILAAGASRRMGEPKMILPWGDGTIIETVTRNISEAGISQIIAVLGADCEKVGTALIKTPAETVYNKDHRRGMLSSVQAGLRHLPESCDSALILPGDQPGIPARAIASLILSYRGSSKAISIATYQGKRGHPVIIHRKYFDEILAMSPDKESLRDFIHGHHEDVEEVSLSEPGILVDIDTKNDYIQGLKNLTDHGKDHQV